jgi:small multidrug resistance family-3 protein
MRLWAIYAIAAFLEIVGCFAFWSWLKSGKSAWLVVPGVLALIGFAWLLTYIETVYAGRAYAAYGGLYIAASLVWLRFVEGQQPTMTDLVGSLVCFADAAIILYGSGHTIGAT